jgi:hypothetical protein
MSICLLQALACTDSACKSESLRVYSELIIRNANGKRKQFCQFIAINMLPIPQSVKIQTPCRLKRKVMNMEDTIPNEIVKYCLYIESMFKDERPIE